MSNCTSKVFRKICGSLRFPCYYCRSWRGGPYGKYLKIEYVLRIPQMELVVHAKSKKQALKEATEAIIVMLQQKDWWKESS